MNRISAAAGMALALALSRASAQMPCRGTAINGTVRDTTAALIPGATVTLDEGTDHRGERKSGSDGRFRFPCVGSGAHVLSIGAEGFARVAMKLSAPRAADLAITLQPGTEASVTVDAGVADSATGSGGVLSGQTISGEQLQTLADDPDDLQRELQQLAAASGGNPANTTISVDGFQGDSALPPKNSIAYVKVNPDLFSAEYREPPFEGGRVEVYTKPGQSAYHGALFETNSSQWMNARDPFSVSRAAIGKQRYGFEFNGPVRAKGSSFRLDLEHRSIDDFAVVNAVTLDASGNVMKTVSNVPAPQRLWVGSARVDWQLGPKNTFFTSFSVNDNHLSNLDVGGTTLQEAGTDSGTYQHTLRFSNLTTASAKLVHEVRLSVEWRGKTYVPASTEPQLQVAGSFTGGGSALGPYRIREFNTEWDDDVILSAGKHTFKAGWQLLLLDEHRALTNNFNGTYIFGGGPAPVLNASNQPTGQIATISGLEQYRRARLNLAGGTPTAFSGVTGNPQTDFTQVRTAVFAQDDWKLKPNLQLSFGFRYFVQNDPFVLNGAAPRAGVVWNPDAKKTWQLHAHVGLFSGQYSAMEYSELVGEDGIERITRTIYNPVYGQALGTGSAPVYSQRVAPDLSNIAYGIAEMGASKSLPHGWNLTGELVGIRLWSDPRTLNINAPLNGDPTGPRPFGANLNILQANNSGWGLGDAEFVSLEQHLLKRVQFFFGAVRVNIRDTTDDNLSFQPQDSRSDAGELARRTGNGLWQTFGNATFKLPGKVQLSANFYGSGNRPYNITTGFDNNGDGAFNDRPQFASPGQSGAVATPYGLLIASGGTDTLRRNLGNLPWSAQLDGNVERSFVLTHDSKAEHQQSVAVNVRSSNLINHTNVTQTGGVLGSPLFGIPYAADNGRRIEAGLRYSF